MNTIESQAEMLTRMRRRAEELTAENYCLRHADVKPRLTMKTCLLAVLCVSILTLTGFLAQLIYTVRMAFTL